MRTIISELPSRRNFVRGRYSVEIGYPWLTHGAIMALEKIVSPDFNVLEFGAGGSTIFFSRHCYTVKTFESDLRWMEKVKKALLEPSNVKIMLSDISQSLTAIAGEKESYYDVILVDNDPSPDWSHRRFILDAVPPLLKKGGYLVIDNYDKERLRTFDYSNWDVYTFDFFNYTGRGTRICIKQ